MMAWRATSQTTSSVIQSSRRQMVAARPRPLTRWRDCQGARLSRHTPAYRSAFNQTLHTFLKPIEINHFVRSGHGHRPTTLRALAVCMATDGAATQQLPV